MSRSIGTPSGTWTRRRFLCAASASAVLVLCPRVRAAELVQIGIATGAGALDPSTVQGVSLAEREGRRQASLLARSLEILRVEEPPPVATRQLLARGARIVIANADPGALAAAAASGAVVLALAPGAEAASPVLQIATPLQARVAALVAHAEAERRTRWALGSLRAKRTLGDMLRRALLERGGELVASLEKRPEIVLLHEGDAPPRGLEPDVPVAFPSRPQRAAPGARWIADWHPDLTRFGAGELNERFLAHSGRPMDEHAWRAWIAVKISVEAALRARAGEPAAALRARAFDGHKGVPLRIDAHGVLVQPVYLVGATKTKARSLLAELPPPRSGAAT